MEIFNNQKMTGKIYSANMVLGGEALRAYSSFVLNTGRGSERAKNTQYFGTIFEC